VRTLATFRPRTFPDLWLGPRARRIQNTAAAGDVILMHTLLLHAVPAAHQGNQPRFLLSTGVQQQYWPV
jgi:hypothetical protein